MTNSILGALNQGRIAQNLAPIKNMLNMVRGAQNPQAAFAQMMQGNPQYAQVSQVIQENGGDPQKAFYAVAQKMGVNGDEIINMLK